MITFFADEPHKGIVFSHPCFVIDLPMFGSQVGVFFDKKDVITVSKLRDVSCDEDQFDPNAGGQAGRIEDDKGVPYFYILYNTEPKDGVDAGLVAHECVHAAVFICDHKGVPIEIDYDEAFAYMVDYLVTNVVEALELIEKGEIPQEETDLTNFDFLVPPSAAPGSTSNTKNVDIPDLFEYRLGKVVRNLASDSVWGHIIGFTETEQGQIQIRVRWADGSVSNWTPSALVLTN